MTAASVPGLFDEATVPYPRVRPVVVRQNHGLVSLICGAVSMVASCLWFISLPLAVSAIILGWRSLKSEGRTLALIGIVLGSFGVLFTIGIYVAANAFVEWMRSLR
jgi:hypothetical protein